jgi:hypothetical protein
MAVTKLTLSKLGEIISNFLLNDFTIWIMNTSATGGYVGTDWAKLGFTSAEKNMNFINEKYNREDKIPRVVTYSKTIRKGMEITSGYSNRNEEVLAMVMQGTRSSVTGTNTGTRIAHGLTEAPLEFRAIRFTSERDDGVTYGLTIPKTEISLTGEQVMGGESEMVSEFLYKAIYNPNPAVSGTASLFYENYWESGVSATADVPPAYL